MNRYLLTIEYDGRLFCGWQKQRGVSTVQETLERALFKLARIPLELYGAGRTDQGVHATGQAAHVDLPVSFSVDNIRRGLNFYLKDRGVIILTVTPVPPLFHARFSAQYRAYMYKILNRPSPSALDQERAWWVRASLNLDVMRKGAELLKGHHDFSAFRSKECGSTRTERTLDKLEIEKEGDYIFFHLQARAFLHQQVRIMIGTLKAIGEGKMIPEAIPSIFASRQRSQAGPTAPPEGLYLTEVGY